jgi:hypothetical protein
MYATLRKKKKRGGVQGIHAWLCILGIVFERAGMVMQCRDKARLPGCDGYIGELYGLAARRMGSESGPDMAFCCIWWVMISRSRSGR